MNELERKFHETWLGLVQPIDGLVFSIPVLAEAQVMDRTRSVEHQHILLEHAPTITDLPGFLAALLGLQPRHLHAGEQLPRELALYVPEGRQTIAPTFALPRPGVRDPAPTPTAEDTPASLAGRGYQMLIWDLGDAAVGLPFDKPETITGAWDYPPAAKFDRLLRHCRVPIGLLINRQQIRLIYAPHGESSGAITFRIDDMASTAGRPILDAFVALLDHRRLFVLAEERRLPALLAESRKRQANVTNELADQVFEALESLLRGFEAAAERDGSVLLDDALAQADDHLYGGLLSVLLRLVFLLYAEDQGLMPIEHSLYAEHMSVLGLFDQLQADAGAHPDSMHRRFGAWDRLVATWRAVYLGVDHGELHMPPRHGQLFDPHNYAFLEGWGPGGGAPIAQPEARAATRVPSIDDGTVLAVLDKLIMFQGQRLSYRALDVEQIGSVYEALMGYHAVRLEAPAIALRAQRARRVWLTGEEPLAVPASRRSKWLKDEVGLSKADAEKLAALASKAKQPDDLLDALDEGTRKRQRAGKHRIVIQPGQERRRTSSHYTPRSLTAPIVARTLEPLIAAIGESPRSDLLLALKICDPAMGSGAFLVEVCRQLADHVVAAWAREGQLEHIALAHGDPVMHARRLVAQRCVYGVDRNPFAVNLAKLSLWLITLAKDLPFTFVDHALRCGDSLVGLSFNQIRAFHWDPEAKQQELFADKVVEALDEAVALRQAICDLAGEDSPDGRDVREKERLLRDAEDAISKVKLIGDLIVGAFFSKEKDKEREKERMRRFGLVREWLEAGGREPSAELLAMQAEIRERMPVFHWMAEFSEVFYAERPDPLEGGKVNRAAFMDAFVGNPPFASKNAISQISGERYIPYLQALMANTHGNADLAAYFFRKCGELLGNHGTLGLIASNTISEGDTRATGIQQLLRHKFTIYHATPSMPWPGTAAVMVTVLHLATGLPQRHTGSPVLDGRPVRLINSMLLGQPERAGPSALAANFPYRFGGSKIYGSGFIVAADEFGRLMQSDARSKERVFPLIGGAELNSDVHGHADRLVINFGQLSLEQAYAWPALMEIVETRVKPERDRARDNADGQHRKKYWWQFAQPRPELYEAIAELPRCIASCSVTKHLVFAFQPKDRVFAHTLYVFALSDYSQLAVLQSRIHEPWARLHSSSMRDDLRYAPSECFDTFPFPKPDPRAIIPALEDIGQRLYETRAKYMIDTDQGLTKTYNKLKDPSCRDPEVLELRRLHEELDREVLAAYGWTDIAVPPYGTPTTDAERKASRPSRTRSSIACSCSTPNEPPKKSASACPRRARRPRPRNPSPTTAARRRCFEETIHELRRASQRQCSPYGIPRCACSRRISIFLGRTCYDHIRCPLVANQSWPRTIEARQCVSRGLEPMPGSDWCHRTAPQHIASF